MKKHTQNLLIASLVYAAVLFALVLIPMLNEDMGITFYDYDLEEVVPDTMIYMFSVSFTVLISYVVYLGYFFFQRHKVKNDPAIKFLGVFSRCIVAVIASVLSAVVIFLSLGWISELGEELSILEANNALTGIILGVTVVANFVCFIVFKPRV
jgi:membrane protease YdiL (CAAX protease family)